MPRIGGGGGVPPGAQGPGGPQGPQSGKADFASQVQKATQAQTTQQTQQAQQSQQSQLTGKVKELAQRFASGKLNQKEATREFVSLVIEERFPQFKKKKKRGDDEEEEKKDEKEDDQSAEERLEEAVTELIDRDPALAKKLKTQFNKLSKAANTG